METSVHIRCADCIHTCQDKHASIYAMKRCKDCELDACCSCHKKKCGCGKGCMYRGTNDICPMQTLKWPAIECGNKKSMYYKALLNVNINGNKLSRITWGGCERGERGGCDDR